MISRYGDAAQGQALTRDLISTQNRLREAQVQISSGKKTQHYDQIADQASHLVKTKEVAALVTGYASGNQRAVDRIHAMDGSVQTIANGAERFRALLVHRLDDSSGADVPLDSEIEAILGEIEHALNLDIDGKYLFAGSRTQTRPVAIPDPPPTIADPALYYQGDDVVLSHRADTGVDVAYGMSADDPAFASLISALGQAREAHLANDEASLETALTKAETSIEQLAAMRGALGSHAARLEGLAQRQEGERIALEETISAIEDVDLAEAMTKLAQNQTLIEASYLALRQVTSLSLSDYLR